MQFSNQKDTLWDRFLAPIVRSFIDEEELLFHETPPEATKSILRECFRLLVPGGQVVILDGNQKTLRSTSWLTNIFEEPYIKDYATGNLNAWMETQGFESVHTEDYWFVYQVTQGMKPLGVVN